MTITHAVVGFAALAAVLTIIPGLDTALVLRTALIRGRQHGFAAIFGICFGALTWGIAAALGAAALLAASEIAYRAVTVAGALYMTCLGVSMIVKSFRTPSTETNVDVSSAQVPWWRSFLTGYWTNLLNPKIGVFYIATIPQFIPPGVSHLGMGVLLAGVHAVLGVIWLSTVALGASAARRWIANARSLRIIDRIAGTILVGFGIKLAADST